MNSLRPGARATPTRIGSTASERVSDRQRLVAIGGILGALAASSCCIVPLILFSLGGMRQANARRSLQKKD
jgi:mercuric ion transport protein